tara:strand:+ start:171 stop:422 length:252 start_codon:yes stop_codon:yes gene_type:complete
MDQDKKTDFPDLVRLPPHNHTKHFFLTICALVKNFFKNKNKKEIELLKMKVRLRELELKSKVELELLSKKLETLQYLKSKDKN